MQHMQPNNWNTECKGWFEFELSRLQRAAYHPQPSLFYG